MKAFLLLAAALLLLAPLTAFADSPCQTLTLREMLDTAPQAQAAPPAAIELAGLRPETGGGGRCSATASCGVGSVTCSGSGSCTSVDRACPGQQGHVTCGVATTQCPPCACTNGTHRYTTLSGCCCNEAGQSRGRLKDELCVNGNWVQVGIVCEGLNCPTICPQ